MLNMLSFRTIFAASTLALCACTEKGPVAIDQNAPDVSDDGVNRAVVNIFDTAVATGTFTTLVSALEATGLDANLADESKTYTAFAPTDAAFDMLGADVINEWFANPETMQDVLQYHLVAENDISSADAVGMVGTMVEMMNGDRVSVTHNGKNFFINESEVIVTDVVATNGIIHVIDTVLAPPVVDSSALNIVETVVRNGKFNTLNEAFMATGLSDTLGNTNDTFTLLAPSDEAFEKLPSGRVDSLLADTEVLKNMLLYHVINGQAVDSNTAISLSGKQKRMANGGDVALYLINGELKINEATVTESDLAASNGIIHTIDSVLTPPAHSIDAPNHYAVAVGSIYDITNKRADFSQFAAAIEVAGLDGALGCPIDLYTAFIPTNDAFNALSQSTRNRLFSDPVAMRDVLLQHLLPGRVLDSAGAIERIGYNLKAGNDNNLVASQQADSLWINDAKIVATDITTVNGVIHIIDKVMLP